LNNTNVKILLLNPISIATEIRGETMAYDSSTELLGTIEYVYRILFGFRKRLKKFGQETLKNFDVRFFNTIPTFTAFITDEIANISFYLEHLSGSRGPFFSCANQKTNPSLYESIETAFDIIWDTRSISIFNKKLLFHQQEIIDSQIKKSKIKSIPSYLNRS